MEMIVTDGVDYRTQPLLAGPEERVAFRRFYLIYLVATAVPATGLVLLVALLPGVFIPIFRDFKTNLPAVTELVLETGLQIRHGWGLLVLPPVVVWPLIPAKLTLRQKRVEGGIMIGLAYMLILLVLSGLVFTILFVALFLPLVKLIQSVSGT
jgi:type II secretory pathway component PulF